MRRYESCFDSGDLNLNIMKQIKNFLMLFVMMFVANTASAQYLYERDGHLLVMSNGYVYDSADVPGANTMAVGDNVPMKIQNYFMALSRTNPERYQREYNMYCMRGMQPVGTRSINGMMMGGAMGGAMMMGNGAAMGGMVMGNGGMAGATSSVHIDNSNMVSTIGSGINMMYDSSTGNVGISGDPLMAIGRVVSAIGGSKKAKNQQQVVYVDSRTGQVIGTQTQQGTQTRSAQRTTTNSGVASQPVYNVYSGF